jgi:hypothetical protein
MPFPKVMISMKNRKKLALGFQENASSGKRKDNIVLDVNQIMFIFVLTTTQTNKIKTTKNEKITKLVDFDCSIRIPIRFVQSKTDFRRRSADERFYR